MTVFEVNMGKTALAAKQVNFFEGILILLLKREKEKTCRKTVLGAHAPRKNYFHLSPKMAVIYVTETGRGIN